MTLFLLISFLIACILGLIIGWRAPLADGWPLVTIIQMLSSVLLAGALIVAAEAGSAAARTLGLLAVLASSAALCGGFAAARRLARGTAPRP